MSANRSSEPTTAQIRAHRDRILGSKIFSASKRQSAFLDYVINAALDGRADKIKEFTLGIEVFERDESFDPGVDSIVRVEASRLRAKLREYYADEGRDESVRIEIPKGHYVPVFRLMEAPRVGHSPSHRWQPWAGLAIAAIVITSIYFTFSTLLRESELPTATEQIPPPTSLAVLPLRDFSSSSDEYFSQAMTDALISSLAETKALRVTSLTSVLGYEDTQIPIPEIGRALGVAYIVEGSIYRDDEDVRITAQLIAAEADEHVWSATFDRSALDLMSMQTEVSAEIAAQVSDELLPRSNLSARGVNPAAYEAFMKGRYFYNQFTADGFRQSMAFFQQAIDIEPDYAEAYAGLASCHCLLAGHGLELMSPIVAIPEAHSLAMKALSLNSELAEPNAFLGIISFKYGWDLDGAEEMLNRALAINPSLFQAYLWHSQILEAMGRHEDAVSRARYAKQLNPLSLAAILNLGWQLYQAGNYIEADAEIDQLIAFNPNFWGGHWAKGHIYKHQGMYESAITELRRAVELEGGHSLPMSALGHTFAIAGMPDEARRIVDDLDALSEDVYVSPFHVATIFAGLNEPDLMFERLEQAYQVRARSLAWLQATREMEPFHNDERYQDLLERIGIYSGPSQNSNDGV